MANKKKGGNNSSDDEIRYYLEAYGIHSLSEATAVTPESMAESGYKEIPHSHMGQIGMMFQQLPGLATHAVYSVRVYHLLFRYKFRYTHVIYFVFGVKTIRSEDQAE